MHKLTRVEAERLMAVMQETLTKLEILQSTPIRPSSYFAKELRNEGKQNAADKLQELWLAETNRTLDVRVHTRGFLRLVARDSQLRDKLEANSETPSPAVEELINRLKDLKAITYRKLRTTVEAQEQEKATIEKVAEKMKQSEEDRNNLLGRLNAIRKSKEEDITALDNTIRTLKGEISYLRTTTEQRSASLAKETEQESNSAKTAHEAVLAELNKNIAQLQGQIKGAEEDHKAKEIQFRKKKKMQQIGMQSWVAKYDKEVTVQYDKLEELKKQNATDKVELAELTDHFRKWDAEHARIADEERLVQEELAEKEAAQQVLDDAAVMMQCRYRGYLQRKKYKALSKKKGKGKKGKKKKKKN